MGGRTQGSITKIQPPQAQDWATVLHSQTQPEQFMNVKMFQRSAQALFLPLLLSSLAPLKPHRAMVAQPKEGHSWALPSPCGLPRRGGGRQSWGVGKKVCRGSHSLNERVLSTYNGTGTVWQTLRQHSIRHGLKRAVRWENRPIGIRLHSEQSYCPDPWRPAPSSGGGVKLNLVLPI